MLERSTCTAVALSFVLSWAASGLATTAASAGPPATRAEDGTPRSKERGATSRQRKLEVWRREAEGAWSERHDRQQLERAIALWRSALREEPEDPELLVWLARAHKLLADGPQRFDGDRKAMVAGFERGTDYALRALRASSPELSSALEAGVPLEDALRLVRPPGAVALLLYGANLAKLVREQGVREQWYARTRIFAAAQRSKALDETILAAGPHRLLGSYYALAPTYLGGHLGMARSHFERALALEPRLFETRVLYAEHYAKRAGDWELYERLLREVVEGDAARFPERLAEQLLEQRKAALLLALLEQGREASPPVHARAQGGRLP
jgi:tetratricopeptide (TPR) repeat protein